MFWEKHRICGNLDNKCQITGTFVVNFSEEFLSIQLTYTGKSCLCHPKVKFTKVFDITHPENHLANKEVVISRLDRIVFPCIEKKRDNYSRDLLFFDAFLGQTALEVNNLLEKNNCLVQLVPCNHVNLLQWLHISVNRSVKTFISKKYYDWYASKVTSQLERHRAPQCVNWSQIDK